MRVAIYETIEQWDKANQLAHETLIKVEGYTSEKYSENPLMTNDNKYLLPELEQFANELKGFNFVELDLSTIKQFDI